MALKRAEMSRFAAIGKKAYVEEMTTAVFCQSKISLVTLGEKFSGTHGNAEGNIASFTRHFFPTKN